MTPVAGTKLFVALTMSLTLAGCGAFITVGGGGDRGQIDKISASGKVEYDLTRPRTAMELGMPADMTSGIIERPHGGNKYLHIAFTLPGGTVFTNDRAFGVGVAAPLTYLGDNSIVVNTREESLAAILHALRVVTPVLGLDTTRVNFYINSISSDTSLEGTRINFIGKNFSYLSCDVEILPDTHDVTINYHFTWDTGPTPAPPSETPTS